MPNSLKHEPIAQRVSTSPGAKARALKNNARAALRLPERYSESASRYSAMCLSKDSWSSIFCALTFEFTRLRKRAKPAVAGRVQRRVRQPEARHRAHRLKPGERSGDRTERR